MTNKSRTIRKIVRLFGSGRDAGGACPLRPETIPRARARGGDGSEGTGRRLPGFGKFQISNPRLQTRYPDPLGPIASRDVGKFYLGPVWPGQWPGLWQAAFTPSLPRTGREAPRVRRTEGAMFYSRCVESILIDLGWTAELQSVALSPDLPMKTSKPRMTVDIQLTRWIDFPLFPGSRSRSGVVTNYA